VEENGYFFEKNSQKPFAKGEALAPTLPKPPVNQSFFGSFRSQKEPLPASLGSLVTPRYLAPWI
jgi:hypothetical protein